jgi:hypothetical protein
MITHPRRTLIENLLLAAVFVGMLAFFVNSYYLEQRVYKQKTLHYQLTIIRQGVKMYDLVEKKFPDALIKLATTTYRLPGEKMNHYYIDNLPVGSDGQLLDPFGNPYAYDSKMGWVKSVTPGYSYW